ncbi:peptide chain release factor 1-like, mitochondrial [Hylaeus volcanicus]|uniref:peptide chain release factor 1-like, mitochondrial n=1 Tax=Hylaeus volcanicus TaxID=313075 RepID=UPI0023B8490D|nr:peptide chain release factor 1-like, mitochondrial [Hylaeus volcanicus]
MLFFVHRCKFNTCWHHGNIIKKLKSFESWFPLLHNLNKRFPSVPCKLFCSKTSLSPTDDNVKRYFNHLLDAYQNKGRGNESFKEIFKIVMIPQLLNEKLQITENIKTLSELVGENEEMKNLAKEEESMYKQQLLEIDEKILDTILRNLGEDNYENVVLEITPGVGGQESMLFAKDLFDMYIGYVTYLGFDYEIMDLDDSEKGGIRKGVMVISNPKAFRKLGYEGGVHRVQRIPATDNSGRVHTSTATVAILPEPKSIDVTLNEKDLRIETKRASGAGGQHVNTTDSAIRVVHLPTGTIVTCQIGRSQIKNKNWALIKLKSILYEQQLNKQTSFIASLRKKQMGMKLRNEKIRTYNYNQDRVTDHRIANGTMYYLKEFLKGGPALEELEERLHQDMQQKLLLEIIQKVERELK